jgi:hypothetical protein
MFDAKVELQMKIRPGLRLRSAVCETEVIVVRAPAAAVTLECGGRAMLLREGNEATEHPVIDPAKSSGSILGKRYADDTVGIELLCTRSGAGTLTADGLVLGIKNPKPLPASD